MKETLKKWQNLDINLPRESDLYVFKEVLGQHDQYCLQLFTPLLAKEDCVIDLGAHIGLFSLAVARHVKNVIALEPDQENFAILADNISRNNISNIAAINKAIAKEEGMKNFYKSTLSPARHSFHAHPFFNLDGVFSETRDVPTLSLAGLLAKMDSCKLVKADIEGAEYEVFFHCPPEALKKIKILLIEYHNISETCTGKALEDFFVSLGFTVVKVGEHILPTQGLDLVRGNLLIYQPTF